MSTAQPTKRRWLRRAVGCLVVAVLVLLGAVILVPTWLRHREDNPVLRGERVAAAQGCFHCHQPDGGKDLPNPGSRWGSLPRFRAGNAMMYAEDRGEIEQFIRFGAPQAWLDDPVARARLDQQLVRMPAYGDRLDDHQIADLVAYASAVEGVDLPGGPEARAGRAVARKHGCTSCHGIEGAGGRANPGALGGFIPGFVGRNFTDLVRDENEFREWVFTGTSTRLARNPVIRFAWQRQAIAMPAYRGVVDETEVGQLWTWVQAIRGTGTHDGRSAPRNGSVAALRVRRSSDEQSAP